MPGSDPMRTREGGLGTCRIEATSGSADDLQRLALRLRPSPRVGSGDRGLGQFQRMLAIPGPERDMR